MLRLFCGILLLIILSLGFISVGAEEHQDVVVLKDGSVIYGKITSSDKSQTIELITKEGREFSYHYRDVNSINGKVIRGYYLPRYMILARVSWDQTTTEAAAWGVATIQGIRFKDMFVLGLGLEIDRYPKSISFPIFLHSQVFLTHRHACSFAYFNLGYSIKGVEEEDSPRMIEGEMLEAGFGLIAPTRFGLTWFIDIGYRQIWTEGSWVSYPHYPTPSVDPNINTVRFSLGFVLN